MNSTALTTAFTSFRFSIAVFKAMTNVAKWGHTTAHVNNRKGHAVLAVRYNKVTGFQFLNARGVCMTEQVLDLLKVS